MFKTIIYLNVLYNKYTFKYIIIYKIYKYNNMNIFLLYLYKFTVIIITS